MDNFWHKKLTLKVRILPFLTTFTQLTARLKNFLRGWLLVLSLKEGLVEFATVCIKSEVILTRVHKYSTYYYVLCNTMADPIYPQLLFWISENCHHQRAWQYYVESIEKGKTSFISKACDNYQNFLQGNCENKNSISMGEGLQLSM